MLDFVGLKQLEAAMWVILALMQDIRNNQFWWQTKIPRSDAQFACTTFVPLTNPCEYPRALEFPAYRALNYAIE